MPTNYDAYQTEQKQYEENAANGGRRKISWFKFKDGLQTLRILPGFDPRHTEQNPDWQKTPEQARDKFDIECRRARNVGPNKRSVFLAHGEQGPLERRIEELQLAGDEASLQEAKAMKPQNRHLLWVIDRAEENKGPQLTDWNEKEFSMLRAAVTQMYCDNQVDPVDPFAGFDININYNSKTATGFAERTITGFKTLQPTPLTEDGKYWHEWLSADLFTETGAGTPSEPEYILACLAGTEQQYNENRKNQNAAPNAPTQPANAPASSGVEHPYSPTEAFWLSDNGQTSATTAGDIANALAGGIDQLVMPQADQSRGWLAASQYGFAVSAPPAPAAAATVPAAPAPPPAAPAPANPAAATLTGPAVPASATASPAPPAPPAKGGNTMPAGAVGAAPPLPGAGPGTVSHDVPPSEGQALAGQMNSIPQPSTVGNDLRAQL